MDNNQKVTEDGTYTVYFRPAGDGTEADGYTYIPHGSDADAHGCTNGGYMFKFVETPVAAGTYYLYNPYSGKFLSRGSAGGTRAVADDYGFPINVTFDSEGAYTLDNYDGTGAYGDDYWMYADCKGTRVRTFTLEYQKMKEHVNIPYGIKILGKEIDSSNCGDFTVEGLTGTVTYDPDSKTLTLTDVTIHNEGETNCIRNEEVDGLTINVVSDSKLTSKSNGWGVIYTKKDITITGDGKLTVETVYPNYRVSISGGSLTLKDINMSVSGDLKGYASESDQYLYIDLADDKCIEIGGSVYGFTDIVYLNGSKSLKPEGAWYDTANKYLTAGSGKAVGITFADKDATGIEGVKADGAAAGSKGTYTVDGRRLNGVPARKGMYISGGRKIAVR